MNKNIKTAKELVKIARELIADQKTAKWNWKHPFTLDAYNQDVNELAQLITDGKLDVVLVNICGISNRIYFGDKSLYVQIVSHGNKIDENDFNNCFWRSSFYERPSKVYGMKVIYAVTNSSLRGIPALDGCASKRDLESYINIAEGEGDNYLDKLEELKNILIKQWNHFSVDFSKELNMDQMEVGNKGSNEYNYDIPGTNLSFKISYFYQVKEEIRMDRQYDWIGGPEKGSIIYSLTNGQKKIFQKCDRLSYNILYQQSKCQLMMQYKNSCLNTVMKNIRYEYGTLDKLSTLFK